MNTPSQNDDKFFILMCCVGVIIVFFGFLFDHYRDKNPCHESVAHMTVEQLQACGMNLA